MNEKLPPLLEKLERLIGKYIPHIVLIACLFTLIAFIFCVDGLGFVPFDDCLRHCAKAVSGKPWDQILIVRPEYHDHNAGWHRILELVHQHAQTEVPGLISFSIIALFLCASVPLLFCMKRPEAWMAGLLFFGTIYFGNFARLFYGRPYVFAIGGTLLILELWTRTRNNTPHPLSDKQRSIKDQLPFINKLITTTIIFMLMTYIHGSFYLYIIPVGAFLLAGQWKKFLWLLPCLGIGVFLGMLMTGDLHAFWDSQILHLTMFSKYKIEQRFLVTEFWPNPAFAGFIIPIMVFLALRFLQKQSLKPLWNDPVFVLLVGMGILGYRNARFWLDFGIPAMLLWSAREIHSLFEQYTKDNTLHRLALSGGICVAFFLMLSANIGDRWNNNHDGYQRHFPKADDPDLKGWFPEPGGIFYNKDMTFFYNTFAANPHADWRYTLGFEPNIMPDDNLAIYRNIQKENKWISMQPWIDKMTPKDRMVLRGQQPQIENLEWKEAFPGMWWGKLSITNEANTDLGIPTTSQDNLTNKEVEGTNIKQAPGITNIANYR